MTNPTADISLRKAAIVSGGAILIMTIAATVANDLTIERLIVPNDASATANNIKASELQFRTGVFSWLVILICDVLAAWGLYIFLKPVNEGLSLIMAWFRLVYVAILGTAMFNFIHVLLLLSGKDHLTSFGPDQFQSQVLLLLDAFYDMWSIGLVVFGFHIFFLGYLVLKSGYVPKIFGVVLLIAFVGYLITNLFNLLLPEYENYKAILDYVFLIPMLGEVALGFWLLFLFKGVNVQPAP